MRRRALRPPKFLYSRCFTPMHCADLVEFAAAPPTRMRQNLTNVPPAGSSCCPGDAELEDPFSRLVSLMPANVTECPRRRTRPAVSS